MKLMMMAVVSVVAVGTLAACSSSTEEANASTNEANAAYCNAAGQYVVEVLKVAALDGTSTIDQWNTQVAAVSDAQAELSSAAADLNEAQVQNLQDAADAWQERADSLSGTTTIADAKQALSTETQAVEDAHDEVGSAVC